jgi:hypothetical protein
VKEIFTPWRFFRVQYHRKETVLLLFAFKKINSQIAPHGVLKHSFDGMLCASPSKLSRNVILREMISMFGLFVKGTVS